MAIDTETRLSKPLGLSRKKFQAFIFLIIWPAVNIFIIVVARYSLADPSYVIILPAAIKLWLTFALALVVIRFLEEYLSNLLCKGLFWRPWLIHIVVIISLFSFFVPIVDLPQSLQVQRLYVIPVVLTVLQISIYLAAMYIFSQQEYAFLTAINLQEAELNILRAQGNPHFLFNTLDLITAEIAEDPGNATDIVYDLADLLRINVRLATQKFTSVADELKLVSLYLTLQQKRFKDRLTFEVAVNPDTEQFEIPALLLQPVIENSVKHAVAPFAQNSHISVKSSLSQNQIFIVFKDTGPPFEDVNIVEGNGFRILRKTLALHYASQHELSLTSTSTGTELTLIIPARKYTSQKVSRDVDAM